MFNVRTGRSCMTTYSSTRYAAAECLTGLADCYKLGNWPVCIHQHIPITRSSTRLPPHHVAVWSKPNEIRSASLTQRRLWASELLCSNGKKGQRNQSLEGRAQTWSMMHSVANASVHSGTCPATSPKLLLLIVTANTLQFEGVCDER